MRTERWATIPGVGVALLPKLVCPLCWPAYAAIASTLGARISGSCAVPVCDHLGISSHRSCSPERSCATAARILARAARLSEFYRHPGRQIRN